VFYARAVTEGEGQLHKKPEFGQPLTTSTKSAGFFTDGSDLPLFSGTPIPVKDTPFQPAAQEYIQTTIPDMPPIDYDNVRENDRALRHRRRRTSTVRPADNEIFP
jgi:hypothetical protein